MAPDISNVDFARENEEFADDIEENRERNNWVVTVRFYSLLHYIEERLQRCGYNSRSHADREDKILRCNSMDNDVYDLYRFLQDMSRDARYECIRMGDDDVAMSHEKLEEGKAMLGFIHGGGSTKYSVD